MSVTKHIYDFLHLCESHEIDSDELVCILFFLTLEGHANRWCHTLPPASVHSLLTFLKELCQAFDECDNQDVYERISHLRMKLGELVEDISTHFLHLCHEIPERFEDLDFMSQELKHLVHVSQNGEPPNFPSSLTLVDHETPHVSKRVPPHSGFKVEESAQNVTPRKSCKAEKLCNMFPTHLLDFLLPQRRKFPNG